MNGLFLNLSEHLFDLYSVYGLLEQVTALRALILIIDLQTPDLLVETYKTLLSIITSDNINSCGILVVECLTTLVDSSDEIGSNILNIFMNYICSRKEKNSV
jgi:hypothetical protein